MTVETRDHRGTGSYDFYGAHYGRFGRGVAAALRAQVYDEDVGQTGWRTGAEQAEIASLLRLGAGVRLLDVACGAGGPSLALSERTGCAVIGLDVEPEAVALARAEAAARGLADRAEFRAADCAMLPLPFDSGRFGAVLCVDAIVHLPDRAGTLREWARLLAPGGRLLFTDTSVVTGPVSKLELDARAAQGFHLFVPPGLNEAALAACGLDLLRCDDRTDAVAAIAGRWHELRARHAAELMAEEGADWFAQRQRFLATTAELAAGKRLSRFLYLAEKPAGTGP
jgi:SAM-dependent methyltransferase